MARQLKSYVAAALALSLAWPIALAHADETLERIRKDKAITIALANQSPFAFKRPDGSLAGTDFEIARNLFGKLGAAKIDGVVVDWGAMIPGLKAKRFDVVTAGMFIRKDRCGQVAFSNPHYVSRAALLVRKGNPKKLHSFDDVMKKADVMIGAVQGGASHRNLKDFGVPDAQIRAFPDLIAVFSALKSGRVDAVSSDRVTALEAAAADTSKEMEVATPFTDPVIQGKPMIQYGAFVFRAEDTDLVSSFNKLLAEFIGTPAHIELLRKYGLTADEVPPRGVTAADLCK